jgi:nucleoside-diphosphate-sugar epimerase
MKILITGGNGNIAKIIKNKLSYLYDITNLGRTELNILSYEDVKSYLEINEFDILIHTAIIGGRRTKDDPEDTVEKNVEMFDNLMKFSDRFKMIINFDSAAIYDRSTDILNRSENELKTIPEDKYGKSKYLIYQKSLEYKNVYNLRLFNIFHANEEKDRFIKACFIARNDNTILTINEDKYFDFFYELDFIKVIKYYIRNYPNLEKTVNLCYEKKYKLSEIAKLIINNHDNIKIIKPISINNYTGSNNLLKKYNIEFLGLEESLEIYDKRYIDLKDRRIKIIIWSCGNDWKCGGWVVLHYLSQFINDLNHPNFYSKIFLINGKPCNTFKTLYTPPLYSNEYEIIDDNTFIIYPELVEEDFFNCKHVMRWIQLPRLNYSSQWKNTDLIYRWEKYITEFLNKTEKIFIFPYFDKAFRNNNKKERTKTCYLIRKGNFLHRDINFFHPSDSILIDNSDYYNNALSPSQISDIFNECKYFYCYDPYCMYSIYAVICGCIAILYPPKDKKKEEYFKGGFVERNNRIYNYGVAYGNSEEEIKFATDTLAEGEFMYKELFESHKDTVYDFLKDLEIYFKEN